MDWMEPDTMLPHPAINKEQELCQVCDFSEQIKIMNTFNSTFWCKSTTMLSLL
jgi:hypothetical protein